MKTSLEHLNHNIQEELREIADFVKKHPEMEVEMVILFGSYARGDWVSDRYNEDGIAYSYESDIDMLFVMKSEKKAQHRVFTRQIKRRIRKITDLEKSLNIIYHGIDYLNQQIETSQYFFLDIYNEGIVLYDSGEVKLSAPILLTNKIIYEKARESYEQWFKSSKMFFEDYISNSEKGKLDSDYHKNAMFNLHQTCERLLTTILLVFTAYKPKIHDLKKLYSAVKKEDARFKEFFPITNNDEERLFTFLKNAYIDSRYKRDYEVNTDDMLYLEERIKILLNLTETICQEKLEKFKNNISKDV